MSQYKYPFAMLLGAGASKPCGIPTTAELAQEFIKNNRSSLLTSLLKVEKVNDIEGLIRVIKNLKNLYSIQNFQLLARKPSASDKMRIFRVTNQLERIEKKIYQFIREKCLHPDKIKSETIFGPILEISKYSPLNVFTTNYDTIIENVCKEKNIGFDDGFVSPKNEDFHILDLNSFGHNPVQLFKMHGSINW